MCDRPAPREGSIIREDGFGPASVAGESKFPPKSDVIVNPRVNVTRKIVEIMESYKSRPNNFRPIKVDCFH